MSPLIYLIFIILLLKLFLKYTTARNYSNLCLVDKTALVIGGSSGLGYQVVLNLASRGCKVLIANRKKPDLQKIIDKTGNPNIFYYHLDLSSLEDVRAFVQIIKNNEKHLDLLINNSGCGGYDDYTKDGLLRVMQVNYFGQFLLIHLLIDLLKSQKSRIVFVSSCFSFFNVINQAKNINTLIKMKILSPLFQYGNSKVCQIIAADKFATKLKQFNISVVCVHPGFVDTKIFLRSTNNITGIFDKILNMGLYIYVFIFGKTVVEGADAIMHCILDKNISNGGFYWDCLNCWKPPVTNNESLCEEIWKESQILVKLKPEEKL